MKPTGPTPRTGRGTHDIGLRAATPGDYEFCFHLHKAAMGEYVAAIWGWDEMEQREYHASAFDPGQWQIITAGQAAAGVVSVEYRPTEIYLERLEVDPGYQSRGIGTLIIQHLLEQAAERGQPVALDVLAVNARAHQLYKRLGFTEAERNGTANAKIRMSAAPSRTHDF